MAQEKNIYEKGNIKITDVRAVFGKKTYAISDITSIEKGLIKDQRSLVFDPLDCRVHPWALRVS